MNNLIVPYNKKNTNSIIRFLWILPSVLACVLFKVHTSNSAPIYLFNFIQLILLFLIIIFSVGYITAFTFLRNKKPLAILSDKGMWINHYNFIPWHEIEDVGAYTILGTPLEVIGVRVKNSTQLYKQASLAGKAGFFWATAFGCRYHITLANGAVSDEQIIRYAKRYLTTDDDVLV